MKTIFKWWRAPAPWWQFWMPGSGAAGGLVICAIELIVVAVVAR